MPQQSLFKAKDLLLHQFQLIKVAFNPNHTFVADPWIYDQLWILPNYPFGAIEIFRYNSEPTIPIPGPC